MGGFLYGVDPARLRNGDGDVIGGFLVLHGAEPVRPKDGDGDLVGAALLHHQHGDAGLWLFPEPVGGVGRRVEELSQESGRACGYSDFWAETPAAASISEGDSSTSSTAMWTRCALRIGRCACAAAPPTTIYPAAVPFAFTWVEVMGLPMVQTIPGELVRLDTI